MCNEQTFGLTVLVIPLLACDGALHALLYSHTLESYVCFAHARRPEAVESAGVHSLLAWAHPSFLWRPSPSSGTKLRLAALRAAGGGTGEMPGAALRTAPGIMRAGLADAKYQDSTNMKRHIGAAPDSERAHTHVANTRRGQACGHAGQACFSNTRVCP